MRKKLFIIALAALFMVSCGKPTNEKAATYTPPQDIVLESDIMTPEVLWSMNRLGEYAVSPDGKSVTFFMSPKTSGNMAFCNVEVSKADASILSGVFAFNDGSDVNVKVSAMSLSQKRAAEAFRPQIKFDSSWIVTDMR